ncbi:MAG: DUF3618 domain-containing protein [Actinomycetota bacterium]|nr:DUF3618 domain-containing protein [Actinomycetota bacterium]
MGQNPRETVVEIEETREELARKVDELVDRAKIEASALGKKLAIGAVAFAGLLVVGWLAKKRVGS